MSIYETMVWHYLLLIPFCCFQAFPAKLYYIAAVTRDILTSFCPNFRPHGTISSKNPQDCLGSISKLSSIVGWHVELFNWLFLQALDYQNSPFMQDTGIMVLPDPILINGRIFPMPLIYYTASSKPMVRPRATRHTATIYWSLIHRSPETVCGMSSTKPFMSWRHWTRKTSPTSTFNHQDNWSCFCICCQCRGKLKCMFSLPPCPHISLTVQRGALVAMSWK